MNKVVNLLTSLRLLEGLKNSSMFHSRCSYESGKIMSGNISNMSICRVEWSKKRPYRLGIRCTVLILFLTVFSPNIFTHPISLLEKKQLVHIYNQGRDAFYSDLESKLASLPLNSEDREFLDNEKTKKK